MSFSRVRRRLVDQPKPFPVEPDRIVLQWKDSPPSPCLTIYVGAQLARSAGLKGGQASAQLFIGKGDDLGKCALRFVTGADWDYRVQAYRNSYRVHLPSVVSLQHFTFCNRTALGIDAIEVRDGMIIFAYEGIKI
ncbi:hypothetical protein [Novosphingobium sp. ST904]|uniref:hypothetical protein n=1 Tax=Novosphingobium sp. ST904 TaxID=1684385 RepID=UPI0006C86F18|nr:hypothetical protein [Novosphingobium sp. ST904]KPH62315.1 hypothetical protein ADT71_15350 [Novosphingobium sp. ST904]TCM43347.1 hypothetical protein EDF59_101451 [Novosphingobium sp. ST904]